MKSAGFNHQQNRPSVSPKAANDHVIRDWRKGMRVLEKFEGGMFVTAVLIAVVNLKFCQFISIDSIFDNPRQLEIDWESGD
jgi:hypothetical protein